MTRKLATFAVAAFLGFIAGVQVGRYWERRDDSKLRDTLRNIQDGTVKPATNTNALPKILKL